MNAWPARGGPALAARTQRHFAKIRNRPRRPAPVFFGAGFVNLKHWWLPGLLVSVVNLAIWFGTGWPRWKIVGVMQVQGRDPPVANPRRGRQPPRPG